MPPHERKRLNRLARLARLLDGAFRIPGLNWRFGWDGLAGLIPGAGDLLTCVAGAWFILEAHRLGASRGTLIRMGLNIALDFAIGSIPVLGDIFDFAFKAHRRNLDLLQRKLN